MNRFRITMLVFLPEFARGPRSRILLRERIKVFDSGP
jgi:hypothetical protein